ncbi:MULTISPECIES: LysR family transcriptional regulator [unclassified Neptuniibacter]|uniref:LysR family transcriptional regulator n=1 Tax=unclassified Neptuniibacter TaxID=2630693 RepID=UPI0025DA1489|nr:MULTISPECIES: LysR family transcriptional regulator [unclassified Neptuniibacter]|tara:strand:+ start:5663 stop:6571 length:909 start_codon:yes stop_codon:yes gene_type:complete
MHINLQSLDLNLLRLFACLWKTQSVTKAADLMNLSQPATSHALKRLRSQLGDPLFSSQDGKMLPSVRAQQLAEPILSALKLLDEAVGDSSSFDPCVDERVFRIASNPHFELVVLPQLIRLSRENHWKVGFEMKLQPDNPREALLAGQLDLITGISNWPGEPLDLRRSCWGEERFGVLAKRDHPLLQGEYVDLAAFSRQAQLRITMLGDGQGYLDSYLESQGLSREVALTVNGFGATTRILEESDWVVAVSERVAEHYVTDELNWLPLENPNHLIQLTAYWHPLQGVDAGIRWLLDQLNLCLQ